MWRARIIIGDFYVLDFPRMQCQILEICSHMTFIHYLQNSVKNENTVMSRTYQEQCKFKSSKGWAREIGQLWKQSTQIWFWHPIKSSNSSKSDTLSAEPELIPGYSHTLHKKKLIHIFLHVYFKMFRTTNHSSKSRKDHRSLGFQKHL